MRIIPIDFYPLMKTYKSPEAAIEGAEDNPLQPRARADSMKLAGSTIVDAYWTDSDFVIRFSNERFLHIWACPGNAGWEVAETRPALDETKVRHVGAEPVTIRWPPNPDLRDSPMDCSALTAKRRGAEFQRLFVNEQLSVYCRGQLIWDFYSVRHTSLNRPILYVSESDQP